MKGSGTFMKEELENVLNKMQEIYLKHIPNGHSNMRVRNIIGLFGNVSVGMIRELADCPHNIRDNDKAFGSYSLYIDHGTMTLSKTYHSISEVPRLKYCAMHLEKVPFRKIKDNDLEKFLIKWENHVIKFKQQLIESIRANRIYNQKEVEDIYLKLE